MNLEKVIELFAHMVNGGEVVYSETGKRFTIGNIELVDIDSSRRSIEPLALGDYYETYVDPKDVEIAELKATIVEMSRRHEIQMEVVGAKIQELTNPAKKSRGGGKHLKADEVRDIEMVFEKKYNVDIHEVVSTYGSSYTVVHNIKHGTHGKTSNAYSRFLRERKDK